MDKITNYLTGQTVLFAPDRMKRPQDFIYRPIEKNQNYDNCVFCAHNKHMLTDIIFEDEDCNCIIIKNKYPALTSENSSHEVVIDSKNHNLSFFENEEEHMAIVIRALIDREKCLYNNKNIKLVQIFKNNGHYAGASLEHSHLQIMALDYIPSKINTISKNMTKYTKEHNCCYICSLEEGKDIFTFYENDSFKAVTKLDTLMSYTIDILPKRHINVLSEMNDDEIIDFCRTIKKTINAIKNIIPNLNYNISFFGSPNDKRINEDYHFFLQIVPRIYGFAGFEISTGDFVNSILPKDYRDKLVQYI